MTLLAGILASGTESMSWLISAVPLGSEQVRVASSSTAEYN